MKVLVTGAGSLIGHGILRCLRMIEPRSIEVYTADPDHRGAGHWLGHHALIIPMAKDESYMDRLATVVGENQIDILFIGTDPELMKIAHHRDRLRCTTVVSSPNVIQVGEDKWETVNFLRERGFPFPDTALADERKSVDELLTRTGFPLIVKPRIGARSVGVKVIRDLADLERNLHPGTIVQEYLPEATGEFTAGTMTYNGTCSSQIIFRRDLREGNTYRAYSYHNEAHELFLKKLSESIEGVYGPLNFQYRLKGGKPVIFEINTRFSGTTPLRAAVGVNEVELAIQFAMTGKITAPKISSANVAILRTWSDIIVPMDQVERLKADQKLDAPLAEYFPFMTE